MFGIAGLVGMLATPARALVVALAGVGLAWLWFSGRELYVVASIVVLFASAALLAKLGDCLVSRFPKLGVRLLELWILLPLLAGAVGSAAVTVLTVEFATPESAPADTKEVVAALVTGVTSFITGSFVSWASDENDSKLADLVRDRFRTRFRDGYFKRGSDGERWIYSDEFKGVTGWGRPDRLVRARGVAKSLANGEKVR